MFGLGITIRKGALHNELTVNEKTFDLNNKKDSHLTTALLQQFLEVKGFFKKEQKNT